MIIKNGNVFQEDGSYKVTDLYIEKGRLVASEEEVTDKTELDASGLKVLPGLVDIHSHGAVRHDFSDADVDGLKVILKYEKSQGVTSYCPTSMTLPKEELLKIFQTAKDVDQDETCARIVGINMEGPFISPAKKGAQDERNIIPCDVDICRRFLEASEGLVKFIGIAPEESEDAVSFIKEVKDEVHVSLAHTNADYDTALAAFQAGADHAVHLYNAMPPFTHRAPGVVGAAADCEHVWAELICDGVHIHPATVRATFKMLGDDRIVLISDSMRATGMPDGVYTLGGLDVQVKGNRATLVSDGALAGSVTNLMDCMRTAVKKMDISLESAVKCATINPARCLGIDKDYGSITAGKYADLVLLDQDLNIKQIIKKGALL